MQPDPFVESPRGSVATVLSWTRVLLLCSYPILGTAIAFYFTAVSDQGVDLLLDSLPYASASALEGAGVQIYSAGTLAHLMLSAASVIIAALSIWWPARLLVRREFPFFPVPQSPTWPLRKWLPRVLATFVVVGVAVGYARIGLRFDNPNAWVAAGAWLIAPAFCVSFFRTAGTGTAPQPVDLASGSLRWRRWNGLFRPRKPFS